MPPESTKLQEHNYRKDRDMLEKQKPVTTDKHRGHNKQEALTNQANPLAGCAVLSLFTVIVIHPLSF